MKTNACWAHQGSIALETSVMIALLAVLGIMAWHGPALDEGTNGAAALAVTMLAPAKPAMAAGTLAEPFYFPSQYQLNAPEGETAQPATF